MSESKFTKGPWQLMQSNPERDGADCWTLLAQPHPGLRGFTRELAILAGPIGDENARANAQLIAAAPDLARELHMQVRNCPVCKGDAVYDNGFEHILGSVPKGKMVACDRCGPARDALNKAGITVRNDERRAALSRAEGGQ